MLHVQCSACVVWMSELYHTCIQRKDKKYQQCSQLLLVCKITDTRNLKMVKKSWAKIWPTCALQYSLCV